MQTCRLPKGTDALAAWRIRGTVTAIRLNNVERVDLVMLFVAREFGKETARLGSTIDDAPLSDGALPLGMDRV
jgi:hypothetical protein